MPETFAPDSVSVAPAFLKTFRDALGLPAGAPSRVRFAGAGELPSAFAVTDFAAAAIGAAGLAVSELIGAMSGAAPEVSVDRRLASGWFGLSIRPVGLVPAARLGPDRRGLRGPRRLDTAAH